MLKLVILLAVVACALSPAISRSLDGRIVGGSDAEIESYPYTVQLRTFNGLHFCGGVIYSRNIIITSAFCIFEISSWQLTVLAGSTSKNSAAAGISVEARVVHEEFDPITKANDIALLRLESDLVYSSAIRNIELATEAPADGADATVVGWGTTKPFGIDPSTTLLFADVHIVNNSNCASKTYGYKRKLITSSVICATAAGSDFCYGDYGGPLVASNELVGIISWNTGECGNSKYPGVYVDIAQALPWITETVARMLIDI